MRHQTVGFYTEDTRFRVFWSRSLPMMENWWLYEINQADWVFECSNGKFDDRGDKYALIDAVIRLEQTAGYDFNSTFWLRPLLFILIVEKTSNTRNPLYGAKTFITWQMADDHVKIFILEFLSPSIE